MDFLRKLTGTHDDRSAPKIDGSVIASSADALNLRANLYDLSRSLSAVAAQVEDLTARVEALGGGAATGAQPPAADGGGLEARVSSLETALLNAETRASQAHERAARAEDAVSHAAETLAQIQALDHMAGQLTDIERQLPAVREECRQILVQQSVLADAAEHLRESAAGAMSQALTVHQDSTEARDRAESAARTLAEVQQRIDALDRFDGISRDAAGQLQGLNALAERVTSKVKALEQQHDTIEHALAESRKVGEMVWNLDAQITKLQEGTRLADRVEWSLTQLSGLQHEATTQLAEAVRGRAEFTERFDRHRREATELMQHIEGRVDYLALHRTELDTINERLSAAHDLVGAVEQRATSVSASQDAVRALAEQVEAIAGRVNMLTGEAKALGAKHQALESLEGRLTAASQDLDRLADRQRQIEALKASFAEFDSVYERSQAITAQLRADAEALTPFIERTTAVMQRVHALESSVAGLQARTGEVEQGARRALELKPLLDEFAAQSDRTAARLHILEDVQTRLNELHELSADVDRKLTTQLARDASLEAVRRTCDGLSTRLLDVQRTCDALTEAERRFAALPDRMVALDDTLARTHARMDDLQRDADGVAAHRATLDELAATARGLAEDLARLRGAQQEIAAGSGQAQQQLEQLSLRCQALEQARGRVEDAERLAAGLERRLEDLVQSSAAVDAKIDAIAGRERIVDAVKDQLAAIHDVARKTQGDLAAVVNGQSRVAESRAETQRLLETLGVIGARLSEIETRMAGVDDVRRKADAVTGLLDDIHVALNTVAEQKAMLDHVTEQLARLDETVAEARGTTKALQAERKLSQRIVENLRGLHSRSGADSKKTE